MIMLRGSRVVVTCNGGVYTADRPDLPGSPIVGYGKTWKEALGDLLWHDQIHLGIRIEIPKEDMKKLPRRT